VTSQSYLSILDLEMLSLAQLILWVELFELLLKKRGSQPSG
jgi:hypothetical protein